MKKYYIILSFILTAALCGCGQAEVSDTQEVKAASEANETVEVKVVQEKAEVKQTEANDKKTEPQTEKEEKKEKSGIKKESVSAKESTGEEEALKELLEYTVTTFEETKIMYASNPVNVRKGPTTDFERVGGLSRSQEVTVTGQADSGWYEIIYGEDKAFVSKHYLQDEKPVDEPAQPETPQPAAPQPQEPQPVQAVAEVRNVAGVILVGDSRFVQMQANAGENSCTWIAENGKGYTWLSENAIARVDGCVGKGSKILINLGVNDPGNLKNYLELVNAKAAEWVGKGAKVYYASVNPVWENPYVTEEQVQYFNSQLQGGLSGDIHYIDSHSYLHSIGYKLVDGLHFNAETYQNLFAYYMSCL